MVASPKIDRASRAGYLNRETFLIAVRQQLALRLHAPARRSANARKSARVGSCRSPLQP